MNFDFTLVNYFWNAGIVVKLVMLLLLFASIFSWTVILQKRAYLKNLRHNLTFFENKFWSGEDLSKLYLQSEHKQNPLEGIQAIFYAGYKEFIFFNQHHSLPLNKIIENVQRALKIAILEQQEKMERQLSFLSIVASTSPYVGLFGTVWGIMQAFRALENVQQAAISMVAPGIAEALIATALGLFAAIPAVIAYNRYVTEIGRILNKFDGFADVLINLLYKRESVVLKKAADNKNENKYENKIENSHVDMKREQMSPELNLE